jgi:hypothetical protein
MFTKETVNTLSKVFSYLLEREDMDLKIGQTHGISENEFKSLFLYIDKNDDGYLDKIEVKKFPYVFQAFQLHEGTCHCDH